jgi:hypothetical protein
MQMHRPRFTRIRMLALIAAALAGAALTLVVVEVPQQRYLTVNPSLTQRFVQVPSEQSLIDLSYRLQSVQGVTGVSFRDYSTRDRSALVTVFFNPRQTSVRQLKIFMLHTRILWQQEMNV